MEKNKRFNKRKNIYIGILVVILLCFIGIIFYYSKSTLLTLITSIFCIVVLGIFILYILTFDNYMKDIFKDLSDMICTLSDLKEVEIFSIVEDNMLSKLQLQVLKLSGILKGRNENINKEKEEIKTLISDISHQLKTPLANLKMYFDFLKDESLTKEEKEEFTDVIEISLKRLEFLIESIIKMSRLEGGVINLRCEKYSLNDTVLIALRQCYEKANKKHIEIIFNELSKVTTLHDRVWTTEALFNIIDNAIKYTNEYGKIKVTIESYNMFVHIDIEDNGVGIKEEEQAKIFGRFYRGKNTLDVDGIGIGLYLSRKIISMEDGYIKVKSNENGSKFSVFLPLEL